ncbi:MAG: biosynthetic peptidoglycan transglycosylase [Hyphomicrobiaceae bacterium]
MIKATLATEDRRFFEHYGIDVLGTLRALVENLRANEVVQGGSSITQQLAKNLFLSSERSLERKVKEAFLALWLEHHMTKEESSSSISTGPMGGGAFGVEAAAQVYFGKSIREVSLAEAAMPNLQGADQICPAHQSRRRPGRADEVLTNMVQAEFMTEGGCGARLNPATPIRSGTGPNPDWFLELGVRGGQPHPTRLGQIRRVRQDDRRSAAGRRRDRRDDARPGRPGAQRQSSPWSSTAWCAIVGGRDYGEHLQPRHPGAAPGRLDLQALCLSHRHGERLHTLLLDARHLALLQTENHM